MIYFEMWGIRFFAFLRRKLIDIVKTNIVTDAAAADKANITAATDKANITAAADNANMTAATDKADATVKQI